MSGHTVICFLHILVFAFLSFTASCSPLGSVELPILSPSAIIPRSAPILRNSSGVIEVFNPDTLAVIPQGDASDGAGTVGSPAFIIWVVFCFLVGVPMALGGVRGWRFTIGISLGCGAAGCAWAAINNAVNDQGISDILIVVIVLAFFSLGFILGMFEFARQAGMLVLAITGGLGFGLRVVLLRSNLLVPIYWVNWLIVGLFGALPAILFVWLDRAIVVSSCTSLGTFLVVIAVDLIVNKLDGISRGLRFIFDRNKNHFVDISRGYHPTLTTQIMIAVSLGLILPLAYLQHHIFKEPFHRKKDAITEPSSEMEIFEPLPSRYSRYSPIQYFLGRNRPPTRLLEKSRFSL